MVSFKRFIHHLINLLPFSCLLCYQPTSATNHLCHRCERDLPILSHYCEKCAQTLPFSASTCGNCQNNPPFFDVTHALFPYQSPVAELITGLKFRHRLVYAKTLGTCLLKAISQQWYFRKSLPDLIIPVPLHPQRLRERGFNQALEIAKPLARALKRPIDTSGLQRIKHTTAQSHLSANARKLNMANAFTTKRDYTGLTIALVDDVMTTGHTVNACSHVLKLSGAKSIHVWCCARRS